MVLLISRYAPLKAPPTAALHYITLHTPWWITLDLKSLWISFFVVDGGAAKEEAEGQREGEREGERENNNLKWINSDSMHYKTHEAELRIEDEDDIVHQPPTNQTRPENVEKRRGAAV